MVIERNFRGFFLLIFVVLILFFMAGCKTTNAGLPKQDLLPLLSQDLSSLKNSNGKIIESELVNVGSNRSISIEIYKIKYLSDGLKVVGFIVKPKLGDSKLPAIVFNRGGNREFFKINDENFKYLSFLASHGYVVLAPQYRGSDGGQGKDEYGGNDINDVLNMLELSKSLPFVNPSQIVMMGYSRGGMMTYLAIKHGAEIKAAAVVGGLSDLEQSYNERDEGFKKLIRDLVGTNKSEWEKRSAAYWPQLIEVPVLILHGEDDWRVDVKQATSLSKKLEESGKVHELVTFPKGDHGLGTHRSERDQKIFDWFRKYLND